MKKFFSILVAGSMLMSVATTTVKAQSVLNLTAGAASIEGVNVSASGKLAVENRETELKTLAAGLRKKMSVIKVYVLQVLASSKLSTVQDSVNQSDVVVLALDFKREVDGATVQSSFADGFNANKVEIKGDLVTFLKAVEAGGKAEEGGRMIIALERKVNGAESITFESTSKSVKTLSVAKGTADNILKIWFGNSADSGLESLKEELLRGI